MLFILFKFRNFLLQIIVPLSHRIFKVDNATFTAYYNILILKIQFKHIIFYEFYSDLYSVSIIINRFIFHYYLLKHFIKTFNNRCHKEKVKILNTIHSFSLRLAQKAYLFVFFHFICLYIL